MMIINEKPTFKYWMCFTSSGLIFGVTPMFVIDRRALVIVANDAIYHLFQRLGVFHPFSNEYMEFEALLPADIKNIIIELTA